MQQKFPCQLPVLLLLLSAAFSIATAAAKEFAEGKSTIAAKLAADRDVADGAQRPPALPVTAPLGKEAELPLLQTVSFNSSDIGEVGIAGNLRTGARAGEYIISGSGTDILNAADEFHFARIEFTGNGSILARVKSIVDTNRFAKAGVMFRDSLDADAKNVAMEMMASTGSAFQYRPSKGSETTVGRLNRDVELPYWIRLERYGDRFTGYLSADGKNWILQDVALVAMPDKVFVGLASTAHNNDALTRAVVDNLSISSDLLAESAPNTSRAFVGTGTEGFVPFLTPKTFDPLGRTEQESSASRSDSFYTYRGPRYEVAYPGGRNEDQEKMESDGNIVFRWEDNEQLQILGIDDGKSGFAGYLSTADNYRNYHLSLRYKWGDKNFPPYSTGKQDSALFYHMIGPDVVWPTCIATQIEGGGTGDLYFLGEDLPMTLGSSEGTVSVAEGFGKHQIGGELTDTHERVAGAAIVDLLTGWNRVEVIVEHDNVTAIVNGTVVNRATNLRWSSNGLLMPLTEGRIGLQVHGAEVVYRDLQIKPAHATGGRGRFRVLVYQEASALNETAQARVRAAAEAIAVLGETNGFDVDIADSSADVFTENNLSQYAVVVWNGTSGNLLPPDDRYVFESYLRNGGGFVGLHEAATAVHDWQWYNDLVGNSIFSSSGLQKATVRIDSEAAFRSGGMQLRHPAADSQPRAWSHVDRWWNYRQSPRTDVNVLLTVDESTYNEADGSAEADDHPIAWWHDYDGGRSFYTGIGQHPETYFEPLYLMHLLGGIEYAAGASRVPPQDAIVLFDGSNFDEFEKVDGGGIVDWSIDDEGSLAIVPGAGSIQTKRDFSDCRVHLEFKVPATPLELPPEQRGNSGLILHGSYELQILDSYHEADSDALHSGAIYGQKPAEINAALPAETWQVYDVEFTAPRFSEEGSKIANARITAYLNGKLIHDDVEITAATPGAFPERFGPRPITLQYHDLRSLVKFRNIWVTE